MSDLTQAERIARLSWLLDGARAGHIMEGRLTIAFGDGIVERTYETLSQTEVIAALGAILAHLRSGQ